jgi:hypothetical protein
MPSFEELLATLSALPIPQVAAERVVEWCDGAPQLGLAREPGEGFELFIRGERLLAGQIVSRHLRFDQWQGNEGLFRANRLMLPADPHFLPVAAFLAEELIRAGIAGSTQKAFTTSEPIIEMALRRAILDDNAVLGLIGELYLLEKALSMNSRPAERTACVESWRGHERAARDFLFPAQVAVEVKVTTASASTHHINNLLQVDPRRTPAGEPLENLHLFSLGLQPRGVLDQAPGGSLSLPSLVETILGLLGPDARVGKRMPLQELFLSKVKSYGGPGRSAYDHDRMKGWSTYQRHWDVSFTRIYYMNPPAVEVLRAADLAERPYVRAESLEFDVDLPDQIPGEANPVTDVDAFAALLFP